MTNKDLRPVLWIALVVLAVANGAANLAGMTLLSIVLGALTVGAAVSLVVQYRRHRRTAA